MAPKKKQQQSKRSAKPSSKPKPQSSGAKPAPKLQISAENERRLRRLLLNTERPPAAPPIAAPAATETLSRAQRAKRLRNVYDKLSLEGFSSDQIEQALAALNETATFETALDWLCLNIPGHELPLKFSTGASSTHEDRSIKIISTAREDWVPIQRPVEEVEQNLPGMSVRIKGHHDEVSLELGGSSQADWIRQYMEQQEEVEEEEEDEEKKEEADPSSRASLIAKEYHNARLGALVAKQKGDKKSQDYFSDVIYKLKQEMSSLGLSDEILASQSQNECANLPVEMSCDYTPCTTLECVKQAGAGSCLESAAFGSEYVINSKIEQGYGLRDEECSVGLMDTSVLENAGEKSEAPDDLELDNLFSEDSFSSQVLPPDRLKLQKKESLSQLGYGCTLGNIDDIWKKGDPSRIPKSVLQRLCQRLGWEAPKYSKLLEKEDKFLYAVSVLRTATGRGKSRKAGGLMTIHLPDQAEALESVEDAQNKVAAYALSQLFPDLPLCQMLAEPYASFIIKWQEDKISTKLEESENIRRAGFVDSLLAAETSPKMSSMDAADATIHENSLVLHDLYKGDSSFPVEVDKVLQPANTGRDNQEQSESIYLKKELENKMKLPKYREMLEVRATLPIAKLKKQLLQLLTENDVIIISGETGCGKTTQVPQFILDDMIESGLGGQCNIICTQPRRIAAISVADRVSDERCESPPGSYGSLIGYQVRLDSARNENTKLLFCTTGILLRKLAGNKDLAGITHVIVDEVHERSLLGDFLLVVLKNLLRRQSSQGRQKLKVVLMSATVDSTLFSRYFGNCPVLSAEGRTHPVSTYFLEDVYEKLEYCLPSDSPASGMLIPSTRSKQLVGLSINQLLKGANILEFKPSGSWQFSGSSVDNHRGKKNLVLSAWGDESVLSEGYINPFYDSGFYVSYSERTHENLKKLKEEVIDYDLLEDLICYIDETYPPGGILVFLPGVSEIDLLVDRLTASYRFGGVSSDWVFPLHSSLSSTDQKRVFLSPPQHLRKVIVATDIAETSITINDVVYVIDSGKHKENRYNPQKKMSSMVEDWISQANAKQRRGRAGRVKPGICFCLYTHHRFEVLMRTFQVPEMLRMPLTELCLQIKSLSLGDIRSFLMEAIEPPREETISSAIDLLYKVGAFEGEEQLSPLGYHLAKLPVDVLIGKMMVYGAVFGCLSPILSIASFLSYKFPFVSPKDEKQNVERAKSALLNDNLNNGMPSSEAFGQSDHLLVAVAYSKWARILHKDGAKAAHRFCRSFFLNSSVMYMIRDMRIQFGNLLADIGLINLPKLLNDGKIKDRLDNWFADISQPFNIHAHHTSIIKSIICAGLYPNVAATIEGIIGSAPGSTKTSCGSLSINDRPHWYDGRREVHIHPSSVNHNLKVFHYPFLVFLEKVETTKVFLRDTSIISPYSILLFGGPITIQYQTGLVIIDGWLKLTAPAQVAVLFKELRLTLDAILKELIRKPEVATSTNNEVVRSIIHLLLEEDSANCSKQ